jgi:hypothetical protein
MVRHKELIMISSYGETSGFVLVPAVEQTAVNGGGPWDSILRIIKAATATATAVVISSKRK